TTVTVEAFDDEGNSASASVQVTVAARALTQLTTDVNDDAHPAWSPDGTRIVFQADRDGAQFDLWIMEADGGNQTRLTTDVNEDRHPTFSPDGAWIAFDSDRAGTFDVWRMPLATGEGDAENLTFGNNDDQEPAFSPDGFTLYFASSRGAGNFDIWSQDVLSSATAQLTSFPEDDTSPSVSPSGDHLAFISGLNFGGIPHAYTMRLGEIEVTPLTGDTGVTEADPAWTSVDETLLVTRDSGLDGNLWRKEMDPEQPAVQVTFGSGTVGDGAAAWHPDGDRVAFHSDRGGNLDIWVLE
ncbi:MAG TPA: hypothetical protein VKU85_00230, partial [bacterium]|nr:hypothetical protein [bacterium]